jgi:2-oxo-4-hydroxy-4-carboxy-5-ureidoimidazoline decarboxylase
LLRAHPELAGREAEAGELTDSSEAEQASAGLNRLSPVELASFRRLNVAYRDKHGFPFVVCVRHYTKAGILAELARRAERDTEAERDEALAQVRFIALLRVGQMSQGSADASPTEHGPTR